VKKAMLLPWEDVNIEDILSEIVSFLGPLLACELRCLSRDMQHAATDVMMQRMSVAGYENRSVGLICDIIAGNERIDDRFVAAVFAMMVPETSFKCDANGVEMSKALIGAVNRSSAPLCALLLKRKAEVDAVDAGGCSVLSLACWHGRYEVASVLMRSKADINASSSRSMDYTPLMSAARFGHSRIARKLLLAKADAELSTKFGDTALSLALHGGHDEASKLLQGASRGVGLCEQADSTLRHKKGSLGARDAQKVFERLVIENSVTSSHELQ